MRRDLVMILVLLVAAVGVVPWAHGRVNNDRANVEIREYDHSRNVDMIYIGSESWLYLQNRTPFEVSW